MANVPGPMRGLDTTQQRLVTDSRLWWRTKAVGFVAISLFSDSVKASVTLFHGVGTVQLLGELGRVVLQQRCLCCRQEKLILHHCHCACCGRRRHVVVLVVVCP